MWFSERAAINKSTLIQRVLALPHTLVTMPVTKPDCVSRNTCVKQSKMVYVAYCLMPFGGVLTLFKKSYHVCFFCQYQALSLVSLSSVKFQYRDKPT